jgi:hypothetical protein
MFVRLLESLFVSRVQLFGHIRYYLSMRWNVPAAALMYQQPGPHEHGFSEFFLQIKERAHHRLALSTSVYLLQQLFFS